ncbi:hypothetical protein AN958_06269 [Leucoagaricus sp. SymC.cos]|nr:hypothetical protein AN958_06269 [Leucoagaricus sp. SymC.cos]
MDLRRVASDTNVCLNFGNKRRKNSDSWNTSMMHRSCMGRHPIILLAFIEYQPFHWCSMMSITPDSVRLLWESFDLAQENVMCARASIAEDVPRTLGHKASVCREIRSRL